ncbi:MAG: hypothetical protein JW846_08710 [Dehalococcoidia bacterium]|nr:hypothetical protein [Dehalococcoidia bacterium]
MSTLVKILVAVCLVGMAAVAGIVVAFDSAPQEVPAPTAPAPTFDQTTTTEVETVADTAPVEEPPAETLSAAFWIEELTAECDSGDGIGVSELPLGADWRTTERGVYSNSPVVITCETGGSTEELTFEWSANFGEVQESGDRIVWIAPDHGAKAQVIVVVQNSRGDEQSATLNFRVATCDCIFQRY